MYSTLEISIPLDLELEITSLPVCCSSDEDDSLLDSLERGFGTCRPRALCMLEVDNPDTLGAADPDTTR